MPGRTEEEFQEAKQTIVQDVNRKNANSVFTQARQELLARLKQLNIDDLNAIEDFYLVSFRLCYALSLSECDKRVAQRGTSFQQELSSFSTDDTLNFLVENFENEISQGYFAKIIDIEKRYKPGINQEWSAIHCRIYSLATELSKDKPRFELARIVQEKLDFLEIKINELATEDEFYDIARTLADDIQQVTERYLLSHDKTQWQVDMETVINRARPFLHAQAGWKQFLDDLANFIIDIFSSADQQVALDTRFSFFSNPLKENIYGLKALLISEEQEQQNPSAVNGGWSVAQRGG
ncbi:hypothetical protein BN59_00850 [Legionella massiliensis]|uniref:Uncharacterized protein n=1 Tax=Legionella massiliensis TaxID=1034943 RepID=A0A078KU62_9GAMM|nr:hypothetical protein [Legionella massiliensis]CDZ76576.1 hypothetical protein BN59_00850 [Legionella massiliensis]CEE12314.1 hypothetical protein BN1094_00850 [Legionella massiliensis]